MERDEKLASVMWVHLAIESRDPALPLRELSDSVNSQDTSSFKENPLHVPQLHDRECAIQYSSHDLNVNELKLRYLDQIY